MKQNDPFAGLRVPRVPEELKARTMRAARAALSSRPTIWDRLWESRPLRAGWVVATIGLIVANVVISVAPDETSGGDAFATSRRDQIDEIRDVIGLPTIEISPRAEAFVFEESTSKEETRDNEVQS